MTVSRSPLRRTLSRFWRAVDATRRLTLNLLFVFLVLVVLALLAASGPPVVEDGVALVVRPRGPLVEQLSGDPTEREILRLLGTENPQTLLRDVVRAIDRGARDERIAVLVLDLDDMVGGGLAKQRDLATAVRAFRRTGKKVVAYGSYFTQGQYLVAAAADEVLMSPLGLVVIQGYGAFDNYFAEALEKLKVDWHVFKVGTYKSAPESYTRNDMSPAARAANIALVGDLWALYRDEIAADRGLSAAEVDDYVDHFPSRLEKAEGDASRAAREAGLVDGVVGRPELRERLSGLVGRDEDLDTFRHIGYEDYLWATHADREDHGKPAVGVIVASGAIVDGSHPPGVVGGDSTAELIRRAARDEDIRALVLRVDSPGGSVTASDVIQRELEAYRAGGKPLVVSMSSVAASGGYYISTASDQIWASPATITGSIGVFAMFPTFSRSLAALGIHTDGVGTSPLSGGLRPDRPLSEEVAGAVQHLVDAEYRDFVGLVAKSRDLRESAVERIAQGRVWSGMDARNLGLVDQLGSLPEATAAAAELASLDRYTVRYVEQRPGLQARLLQSLLVRTRTWLGPLLRARVPSSLERMVSRIESRVREVSAFDDPRGLYAYCFCRLEE